MKCANPGCSDDANYGQGNALGATIGWCHAHLPKQQKQELGRLSEWAQSLAAELFADNNPSFGQ